MRPPAIDVAAAIVHDAAGRVLVAERLPRQIAAGFWELPGGKIDPGETPAQAAVRELAEETGLRALSLLPWVSYTHSFPTRTIRLSFFRVLAYEGTAYGREGQRLAWVDPAAPSVHPLLPSNYRVMAGLGLPGLLAVSDAGLRDPAILLQRAASAFAFGARLLLVSERSLAPDQRVGLARRLQSLAAGYGGRVILEGSAQEARRAGVPGLLAGARELRRTTARPEVALWGARCRNAADLARAVALGADYAIVAPVLASLDATPPLGWGGFSALVERAPIPIYAQGGLALADLPMAQAPGAHGIAVPLAAIAATAVAA